MKKICFVLFVTLSSLVTMAQEEEGSVELTVDDVNDHWYASPWVWVAGAALIIVLLVLLSRGKENKA